EGHERNGDVGWMRGDAALTDAENGVAAIQAFERRAAGARLALIARGDAVAEVRATNALAQIPTHRGHVPKLLGGAEKECFGDSGEPFFDDRGLCNVAHTGQSTDPNRPVGQFLDR